MEWNDVLQWQAGLLVLGSLLRICWVSPRPKGAIGFLVGLLALILILHVWCPGNAGWIEAALTIIWGVVPLFLLARSQKLRLREQYTAALKCLRAVSWLWPFHRIRGATRLLQAMSYYERGEIPAAVDALERLIHQSEPAFQTGALIQLMRIRGQWRPIVDLLTASFSDGGAGAAAAPYFPLLIRALGETGQTERMLAMLHQSWDLYLRLPDSERCQCRVFVFAFAGQLDRLAMTLSSPRLIMSDSARQFWLATAEIAAGFGKAGQIRLTSIEQTPGQGLNLALAIASRRQWSPVTELSAQGMECLDRLEKEQKSEKRILANGGSHSRPWVTYALILLNVGMYGIELFSGGAMDPETLYRLGAFEASSLGDGQYWRLLAAGFLHAGSAHLVMNMMALLIFGPVVEATLGRLAYLSLYLISGILGFAAVWGFEVLHWIRPELLVGASAAIMGLIGGEIAFLVRRVRTDWNRKLRGKLFTALLVVGLQTFFDVMNPEVSMAAHLGGLVSGFIVGTLLLLREGAQSTSEVTKREAPGKPEEDRDGQRIRV